MLAVFFFVAATQLFLWAYFLKDALRPADRRIAAPEAPASPVSVIVCFHNEESSLWKCLREILQQNYPAGFELLAVNDNSTDGSAEIARQIAAQDTRVRILHPGPTRPGKKDALAFGIARARYEFLLLTDADCYPTTKNWVSHMTKPLHQGADVALGLGLYNATDLNGPIAWQNFEAKYVALKYMGFARRGLPYMGVGRNLAYTKSFFRRAGGLEAHADLPGGDDDLLIAGAAGDTVVARVTHHDSATLSVPAESWAAFFRQRRRHQSTGWRYRPVHQVLLGLLALSHGLFFLLGLLLLFTSWYWLALLMYLIRFFFVFRAYRVFYFPFHEGGGKPRMVSGLLYLIIPVLVAWYDALVGPFYLYLALVSLLPAKRW